MMWSCLRIATLTQSEHRRKRKRRKSCPPRYPQPKNLIVIHPPLALLPNLAVINLQTKSLRQHPGIILVAIVLESPAQLWSRCVRRARTKPASDLPVGRGRHPEVERVVLLPLPRAVQAVPHWRMGVLEIRSPALSLS
jgi:hypothetical protein